MKIPSLLVLVAIYATSCNNTEKNAQDNSTPTFDLFTPITADFTTTTVQVPKELKVDIIFREELDSVITTSGNKYPSMGYADFAGYIPINGSSEHGYLCVNHELDAWDANLKDAGGVSIVEVQKLRGNWIQVGTAKAVDFSTVGGTTRNCSGAVTPNGTVLTTEETSPKSNKELLEHFKDTTAYDGRPRYQNFGWVTEYDPKAAGALRKLYQLGHLEHEGIVCMPDKKTIYFTNDETPCVFFKYIAEKEGDYTQGQLYAYHESADAQGGSWLKLPMTMDSLLQIKNVAIRMGASMYVRHEWLTTIGGKFYINETGNDEFDMDAAVAMGGKPANHLKQLTTDGHHYKYPYGSTLVFDPATNKMEVLIAGGTMPGDSTTNLSNPDCIGAVTIGGKNYLMLHEDIIGQDKNRVGAAAKNATYNEIYFLDLSIAHPALKDLKRMMVAPRGSETSGGAWTPDGSTYFVSIQHPDTSNPAPYNRSVVVAVSGFKAH